MTDFAKLLNPEQCEAATAGDGPLLVLAAAGTGKTRTLVHRVAYLIEQGVDPSRILLLTFTNRAAREMTERSAKVCGDNAAAVWAGTFHSICARLLRRYGGALGYAPGFQILDEDDQKKLVGEVIAAKVANPKDFPKKELVAKMISEAANECRDIADIASRWQTKTGGVDVEQIKAVAEGYRKRKLELGAMDFDDLLVNGLKLLKTQERIRTLLQEHFQYVLVDEYQDTNGLQAEFTDILADKWRNIMAVGDDFQCIYTWRGAQIENIINFPKRWPGCRVVKLERNYRSTPGILDVANVVMKDAHGQFEKELKPFRVGNGAKPWKYFCYDGRGQATEILRLVREMHELGYRYGDMAVLYRSHFQSIDVQMAFARMQIPHRITSGVGVFEQVHTKDVLAYLRLILSARDELSFMRLVGLLPGVGEKSQSRLWAKLGGMFDGKSAADCKALGELLPAKARPQWELVAKAFANAQNRLEQEQTGRLVEDFCDLFYADYLHREYEAEEADDRLNDIRELAAQIAAAENGLEGFLADVALMTNLDLRRNEPGSDRVTLSTVHQAKGMEWPVVFVPWLAEGMFPSQKAAEEGRLDEERRLFYVAVTRAKDNLFLFTPAIRKMPDGGMFPVAASAFVKEIPDTLVNVRRTALAPMEYAGGQGYRGSGGYGGGFGGYGRAKPKPQMQWKTTWRH